MLSAKVNLILLPVFLICCLFLSGCQGDCIYELDTSSGTKVCNRLCPLTDDEGNAILDDNGEPEYGDPEQVHIYNCELPASRIGGGVGTTSTTIAVTTTTLSIVTTTTLNDDFF